MEYSVAQWIFQSKPATLECEYSGHNLPCPAGITGRNTPFPYENGVFRCTHDGVLQHAGNEGLIMIVREITEWRLTSYLARKTKA